MVIDSTKGSLSILFPNRVAIERSYDVNLFGDDDDVEEESISKFCGR